jgi:hypothetical protein
VDGGMGWRTIGPPFCFRIREALRPRFCSLEYTLRIVNFARGKRGNLGVSIIFWWRKGRQSVAATTQATLERVGRWK